MANTNKISRKIRAGFWIALLALGPSAESLAAATDLATQPLSSSTSSVVRPNLLFTLDDSGSMGWAYLPDYAGGQNLTGVAANLNHCKVSNSCGSGETPFNANAYNGMSYNPSLTYQLPVNADGTLKNSQDCVNTGGTVAACAAAPFTGGWTAVKVDGYGVQSASTINLTNGYPEVVYSTVLNTPPFKRNGIDTNNPFSYRATTNGTTSGAIPSPDTNDDPPLYAFPGSLQTGGAVIANVFNGTLNQPTLTTSTVFNGTLDVSTAAWTAALTGTTVTKGSTTANTLYNGTLGVSTANIATTLTVSSITHVGTTVTVNYTALTSPNGPLATGDNVLVSGGSCGTGFKSGGVARNITVVNPTRFTYVSSAGSSWGTPCTVVATHLGTVAPLPNIVNSGGTVTVTLAAAPATPLVNGALVTVANGAGTCDAGYQATAAAMTVVNATTFTYPAAAAPVTPANASCNITVATTTVNVTYTAPTPPNAPLVTGDTVVISGASCDAGFKSGGAARAITRVDATHFTYISNTGAWPGLTTCTLTATHAAHTAVAPKISKAGSTVTVTLAAAPVPPLVAGSTVTVASGAGTCDAGYQATAAAMTVVNATTFTYAVATAVGAATNTSCNITMTAPTPPPSPGISALAGTTVTVYKTGHGLVTGDRVTVGEFSIKSDNTTVTVTLATPTAAATGDQVWVNDDVGAGTCDAGYKTAGAFWATNTNSMTFTYPAGSPVTSASDTGCQVFRWNGSWTCLAGICGYGYANPNNCGSAYRTNGSVIVTVIDANTFTYTAIGGAAANSNCVISKVAAGVTTAYTNASTQPGTPYYFMILPTEYCDSVYLTNCVAAAGPVTVSGVSYSHAAPVRFCKDSATAALAPGAAGAQSAAGATINCQAKYSIGTGINFQWVRYGLFWRGNIIPLSGATTDAVGYAIGSTSIKLASAGTGMIVSGDTISFAGDPNKYIVLTGDSDVSNGGILTLQPPGLLVAMSASAHAITLYYGNETVPAGTHVSTAGYAAGGTDLDYSGFLAIDRSKRADCAAVPNCTYAEEMTNFANWYAYYHTRMQMMKSSAGRAFSTLDTRYRVGFATINESATKYQPIGVFNAAQKTNWYAKFYAINPGSSTPLREAMAHAGRYFAGKKPGIFTDDPMEYSCQQNYELITTDGYWNGTDSNVKEMDGTTTMGNYDNVADSPNTGAGFGFSKRIDGAYDGGLGAANTLADVAMYYYKTDIRNSAFGNCTGALGTDVCLDNVTMTTRDTAAGLQKTQHMSVFSLGLADGLMTYEKDYDTSLTGDFAKIKTLGATGCTFSGAGQCNWPVPTHDSQAALDDLWHAAVNARGAYYNARDPTSLADGLTSALAAIDIKTAAAAASATSSPNITQTDRSIFSSTYRTVKWDGEVTAQLIDPATGNIEPTVAWSAQAQLEAKINADTTASIASRQIYTFDGSASNHLKDFTYGNLTAAEKAFFDNKCAFATLSQCTAANLTPAEIALGNDGTNLVNYLRGQKSLEKAAVTDDEIFRLRDFKLGDTVNAKPAFVRSANFNFTDAGYTAGGAGGACGGNPFKTCVAARQGVLYMGSNDGMLHAFNSDTGDEMWSYIPKIVMPNLYNLADADYASNHVYFVDGSPEVSDIYMNATDAAAAGSFVGWHTILVGGLGLGGRGYYALDVTDPASPRALWEICSDSTLCAISDADIGYTYGNPVITKRSTDGQWVVIVSSGYNNNAGGVGNGQGTMFVLNAATGLVLNKVSTGAATNPPSGLAKLSPWADSLIQDNTVRFIYGGDLNGDVWRFDLGVPGASSATLPTATRITSLKDSLGNKQSVTTRPELGDPLNNVDSLAIPPTGNPAIFVGTGRYLGVTDVTNMSVQSVYGLKDDLALSAGAAYFGGANGARDAALTRQYIYQPTTTTRTTSQNSVAWLSTKGWYADLVAYDAANAALSPSPSPGERVNIDPVLVSGSLIVVTNVPATGSCTFGGTSWLYTFDFLTGSNVTTSTGQVTGIKLPSDAITVGMVVGRLPGGQLRAWITDSTGGKTPVAPPVKGTGATMRSSWRELIP